MDIFTYKDIESSAPYISSLLDRRRLTLHLSYVQLTYSQVTDLFHEFLDYIHSQIGENFIFTWNHNGKNMHPNRLMEAFSKSLSFENYP